VIFTALQHYYITSEEEKGRFVSDTFAKLGFSVFSGFLLTFILFSALIK